MRLIYQSPLDGQGPFLLLYPQQSVIHSDTALHPQPSIPSSLDSFKLALSKVLLLKSGVEAGRVIGYSFSINTTINSEIQNSK